MITGTIGTKDTTEEPLKLEETTQITEATALKTETETNDLNVATNKSVPKTTEEETDKNAASVIPQGKTVTKIVKTKTDVCLWIIQKATNGRYS